MRQRWHQCKATRMEETDRRETGDPITLGQHQQCWPSPYNPPHHPPSGCHGALTGGLGKAISTSSAAHVPEMGPGVSDNRLANSQSDYCVTHENRHQTERKLVAGAPRQEKTDTVKSEPEHRRDREKSRPQSTQQQQETVCPVNVSKMELTMTPAVPKLKTVVEELSVLESPNFDKMKRMEISQKKKTEEEQKESEKGTLTTEPALEDPSVCPGPEKKSGSTERAQELCQTPEKKSSRKKNMQESAVYEHGTEGNKETDLPETTQNVDEAYYATKLDNKLLEELMKTAVTSGGDSMKDRVEVSNRLNKILAQAAKSAPQDKTEQEIKALLSSLMMASKTDEDRGDCEEKMVTEGNKKAKEKEGEAEPVHKRSAIEAAHALSKENQLTNSTLTHIYTCFLQHQPAAPLPDLHCSNEYRNLLNSLTLKEEGSKVDYTNLLNSLNQSLVKEEGSPVEYKNLLNSLNHGVKGEGSQFGDTLKEGISGLGAGTDKVGEGRQDDQRPSVKVNLPSPWHLSELSVDGEQCRLPVENSFYFPSAASFITHPSVTADMGHHGNRGTDLMVILSLMGKFVRQAECDSKRKGQKVGRETDKQKDEVGMEKQEQVDGQADKADADEEENKGESEDSKKGEVSAAAQRKFSTTVDTEEVPKSAATGEETNPAQITGDGDEVMEKSEYEETEKARKEELANMEPAQATEPAVGVKVKDKTSTDPQTKLSPSSKPLVGSSKHAKKKPSASKAEKWNKTRKTKSQAQEQKRKPRQKKGRSACRKKRDAQHGGGHRQAERKKTGHTVSGNRKKKKGNQSPARSDGHHAWPSPHPDPLTERTGTNRNLSTLLTHDWQQSADRKNHTSGIRKSMAQNGKMQKAEKNHLLTTAALKSKKHIHPKKTCSSEVGKKSSDVPRSGDHRRKASHCYPPETRRPSSLWKGGGGLPPLDWDWLDVGGGETTKVIKAGDGPHGSSQGHGSGNSPDSANSGGGSGSQGWGGARPKTNRGGNGGGAGGGGGGDGDDRRPPRRNVPTSLPLSADPGEQKMAPPRNYKRHRKKEHGVISYEQLCHCLGQAGKDMDTLRLSSGVGEVNRCLRLCLHDTRTVTSPSDQDLACCTCAVLHSLLSHFSTAAHSDTCLMCLQLFRLVLFHILDCQARSADEEEEDREGGRVRNVCRRMRKARMFAGSAELASVAKMWRKVRKCLSAALGPVFVLDMEVESEATTQLSIRDQDVPQPVPSPASTPGDTQPSIGLEAARKPYGKEAVPPDAQTPTCPTKHTSPDPQAGAGHSAAVMPHSKLCRRPSQRIVPQKTIPEEPTSPHPSPTPPASPAQGEGVVGQGAGVSEVMTLPVPYPRAAETPEEGEDIMEIIRRRAAEQQQPVGARQGNDDPYATQKVYGMGGTVSMPDTRDRLIRGEQTLSVEMHPVGTPGIGEVVYGTPRQLQLVARNWRQERDRCKASGLCQYQHREEGVILHPFKKLLKILHTRYQKHQQWERLVHLGNGVTGKCHLCIDRSSNFKFCCKKVHILQYEDQELDIWSELDDPNIVRFYGAIRHGEKIYMFAEFIDGGSLAALIKEQWLVGRRLSHWTSLNYFRQLLMVLTYLQTKGILHEDIKADNLLLRDSTTEIVLADFGAAQQIPHDHTPPNRCPTGSPAHWSPEKAASEGHGFSSDLWASACVLIHMLSGSPPWISRFPDAAILNYIIWSKPPPLDDLPPDAKKDVRDLLACCLVKDKAIRPTASQILSHPAFRLLDQASSLFSIAQHASASNSQAASASAALPALSASPSVLAVVQPVQEVPPCSQVPQVPPQVPQVPPQATRAMPGSVRTSQLSPSDLCLPQTAPNQAQRPPVQIPAILNQQQQAACQQAQSSLTDQDVHCKENASPLSQQGSSPLQREWGTGTRPHNVGGGPSPSQSEIGSVLRPRPPVRVVEIPRRQAACPSPLPQSGERCGPQSLPGHVASTHGHSQHPNQPFDHQPVQRKSDPGVSAPFMTQDSERREPASMPRLQRKIGRVLDRPCFTTEGGDKAEGDVDSSGQRMREVTAQQTQQQTPALPVEGGRGGRCRELKLPQEETRGWGVSETANIRDVLPPFHPTPWPDLPSPLFSLTSQATTLSPPSLSSVPTPRADYPDPLMRPGGGNFFPSCGQTDEGRVVSTLTVPAPLPASQDVSAASSEEPTPPHSHLSSYGTTMASPELEPLSQPAGLLSASAGEGHPVGQRSGSGVSCEDKAVTMVKVGLMKSGGAPLQLYTGPHLAQRSAPTAPTPTVPTPTVPTPTTSTPAILTPPVPLPPVPTPAPSHMNNTPPSQLAVSTPPQPIPSGQPATQYPVLPALLPEDIQVRAGGRGFAHPHTILSMIPEGLEGESGSVSPSPQGVSVEEGGGTVWNYIQDQFTMAPDTGEQLLESLHHRSDSRPRLQLYAPPTTTTTLLSEDEGKGDVCRQPALLPRFELLQSSLSDSSTLRNTVSSEESSNPAQLTARLQGLVDSSGPSQHPVDEPDSAIPQTTSNQANEQTSRAMQAGSPVRKNSPPSAAAASPEEEHISSEDMFGLGPHRNTAFEEAYRYREQQHQNAHTPGAESEQTPAQPTATASRSMSRKLPNLRLNVNKSTPSLLRTPNGHAHSREAPTTAPAHRMSESSSASHHGDDAFLLQTGVSPMTASPLFSSTPSPAAKHADPRPRSRNESGSSVSTPRSSTYDRQEQEWNTLQQQTPGLEDALLEDPMMTSGSELSSSHHASLRYESQGEMNTSDLEETEMLSLLQEDISNDNLGGHHLEFEDTDGQFLFKMRVLGKNKGWKDLAVTFRGQIHRAGYLHYKLMQPDGTPVDCFAQYSSTITRVKVIEVPNDHEDVFSVCWCNDHLIY